MERSADEELVGQSHPEGSGQQLTVQEESVLSAVLRGLSWDQQRGVASPMT